MLQYTANKENKPLLVPANEKSYPNPVGAVSGHSLSQGDMCWTGS